MIVILGLGWFTSKQPKLGLTQELSFSLELVSPLQVTHLTPVWDLLLPLAHTPDITIFKKISLKLIHFNLALIYSLVYSREINY